MLRKTILCCCLIAAGPRCAAADADVRLRFDEIGAYALDHSPHARILRRNVDLVEARRDASLTWSNPELSWELEKTGTGPLSDREYTIALAKEFTLPWAGAPHRAAWERRLEAAGEDVRTERGGILPAITLSGGYRNAGEGRDGFVVGLSAPLPFLGRNTGAVNERRAAFETARLRLDLHRAGRDRRVALLVETAAGKAALLDRHAGIVEDIDVQIENLAASYIEGWLSLAVFFEGIEICAGGVADFFGLLGEFYEIVFELEALTERELVRSVPPEREGKER